MVVEFTPLNFITTKRCEFESRSWQGVQIICILLPWLCYSCIYNYLCNQCLSPLKVVSLNPAHGEVYWIQHYKVCQWLEAGRWFSPGTPVTSTNKTDHHDITEILLKEALSMKIFSFSSSDSKVTCKLFPSLRVHHCPLYTISKTILLSIH